MFVGFLLRVGVGRSSRRSTARASLEDLNLGIASSTTLLSSWIHLDLDILSIGRETLNLIFLPIRTRLSSILLIALDVLAR